MKTVSGKVMVRALQRQGWVLKRINGSHYVLRRPGWSNTIIVPVHANVDLKSGTQRGIMKAAELDESDL